MIVVHQGAQAVQDLIKKILRTQLLHNLAIDSRADLNDSPPVYNLDGLGDYSGCSYQRSRGGTVEFRIPS